MQINNGDSLVLINKLTEARNIVRKTVDMQLKYSLTNEKTINKQLEELRKKIFSQQCDNAQKAFDDSYSKGKDALTKQDYVKADNFFIDAEETAEQNKDCGITIGKIIEEHLTIQPAATYLKMMEQVNNFQFEGNYHNAQEKYNEAGNYYSTNNVSIFTIQHESLRLSPA